jgi:hypothetical protein
VKADYAFEFKDLAVLLGLELTEPADHADIEVSNTSSTATPQPTPPSLWSKETGTGQHST